MAVKEKIRIRLQSYDAQLIAAAAEKILETAMPPRKTEYILKPSNKTVKALMSLQLPAGVDIEIKL